MMFFYGDMILISIRHVTYQMIPISIRHVTYQSDDTDIHIHKTHIDKVSNLKNIY